jgi:hypothetical protein
MGEVIHLAAAARSSPAPLTRPTPQMPYETYVAYQQAEAAFPSPRDPSSMLSSGVDGHGSRIVRNWW